MRSALALVVVGVLAAGDGYQDPRGRDHLDPSAAFFYPSLASGVGVVAELGEEPIDAATYLRYLAARLGASAVEDLAFDLALARECTARNLLRSAPTLARGLAVRRLADSGRTDPDGGLRRRYLNEALRQLRVDALVRADRVVTEGEVRALFERRYGPGGVSVRVRHIAVTLVATRKHLGAGAESGAVVAAARSRLAGLARRLADGARFAKRLAESDGRGDVLDEAAMARFGRPFRQGVVDLEPGEVSGPVQTRIGFHLIQLIDRRETRLSEVTVSLRSALVSGPATAGEERRLRRALLEKHRFHLPR